ncbi:MAG: TIM-barrel domain-containing protein [Bryobacteraceae bacterium]
MASINRRQLLQQAGAAALLAPIGRAQALSNSQIAGRDIEIQIATVSPHTFRLTIFPLENGQPGAVADDGSLVQASWGAPTVKLRGPLKAQVVKAGGVAIHIAPDPLSFTVKNAQNEAIQQLSVDKETAVVSFHTGSAPILGLGEGGPQFDRRGQTFDNRSGQGGYQLRTHGGRVPIPFIIGASGWAMFVHQPFGTFDFTGAESKFTPLYPTTAVFTPPAAQGQRPTPPAHAPLPIDLFFTSSREPATIMAEYARLTGHAELPPLWSFGYQQSHRTLASREEVLQEAKTFREKKLPLDALIYLSTGFCPSGWNTNNGEFTFNQKVFPDPKAMFDQLHEDRIKVVLHVAYPTGISQMSGTAKDPCDPNIRAERQTSCYWDMHRSVFALGADGWWPDEGDALNTPGRLVRNRMYWEAPQLERPNERPYALHRNAYAGMQRYASFLWSGDVDSRWETLANHIPDAVNTCLSGIPYWGTDIGGFVPTAEYTGELYVRWFQFGAFNPLFRSHGRIWPLHLPWGWNTGQPSDLVMRETPSYHPDPSVFHNAQVEPICRKYLNLRYQLMPYLYSAVHECTQTGMPVIRALWLHYPDDATAVARGDEYLWGRDMLVAPVVEKGATSRKVYLPKGTWHDFWTNERQEGGQEITRIVDLETTPLYVRGGAIIPMDPIRQYTAERTDAPTDLKVYPGADGSFLLYDDDGATFNHRKGEWTAIKMTYNDARRTLALRAAHGSPKRTFSVGGRIVHFDGRAQEIKL